jgi:hypothetical protein
VPSKVRTNLPAARSATSTTPPIRHPETPQTAIHVLNPHYVNPGFLDISSATEYVYQGSTKPQNRHKRPPLYFRLCESYRDSSGKLRQRMIIALGYMENLPRRTDKQEFCRCLNDMVLRNQYPMCDKLFLRRNITFNTLSPPNST